MHFFYNYVYFFFKDVITLFRDIAFTVSNGPLLVIKVSARSSLVE